MKGVLPDSSTSITLNYRMRRKGFDTDKGIIHYWVNEMADSPVTLIFLPGLSADHRLFEKQLDYFCDKYSLIIWDAPGHNESRPFVLDFTLMDEARWLHDIIKVENVSNPVLIGQSMGGYVAQCFMQLYPKECFGFISIDSAPLQRKYVTSAEIWMLRKCEWMYRMFPWKLLVKASSYGCAQSEYGKSLMKQMMLTYSHDEYCSLAGHGYRILADAMAADLPYMIDCPVLLICGQKDYAAAAQRYNRAWAETEGLPIYWIPNAGHNSNTDCPEVINNKIEEFICGMNCDR